MAEVRATVAVEIAVWTPLFETCVLPMVTFDATFPMLDAAVLDIAPPDGAVSPASAPTTVLEIAATDMLRLCTCTVLMPGGKLLVEMDIVAFVEMGGAAFVDVFAKTSVTRSAEGAHRTTAAS